LSWWQKLLKTLNQSICRQNRHTKLQPTFLITFIIKNTRKTPLFENQCGFRPKHSTIDEVAKFTFHVMTSIENKHSTIAVLLDLSKAFDTIYHQIILNKLDHYGIWGIALDWFRNYPWKRSQLVSYCGAQSRCHDVTCGVPQVSILGPLLFIIYRHDLPNSLPYSRWILFAGDMTIYQTNQNENNLCTDIEMIWMFWPSGSMRINYLSTYKERNFFSPEA